MSSAPAPRAAADGVCPVCACTLAPGELRWCPGCETPHHADCWEYNGGCAIYACPGTVPTPALASRQPVDWPSLRDGRFVFVGETEGGGAGPVGGRLASLALTAVAGTGATLVWGSALLGVAVFLLLYFVSLLVSDRVTLDAEGRRVIRSLSLGPLVLRRSRIPFADVAALSLRPYFGETGWQLLPMVRGQLRLRNGASLGLGLDLTGHGLTEDDVGRWASALGAATGLPVVRAPLPHRRVLLKRLRAYQGYLEDHRPLSSGLVLSWRLRWLLVPLGLHLGGLYVVWVIQVVLALAAVTAFFTFVTPSTLLGALRQGPRVDPYPDPWIRADEAENLTKVDGFLTLVEEKRLPSVMGATARTSLYAGLMGLLVLLVLSFLPSGPLAPVLARAPVGWVVLCLAGMVGGELTRARWDEEWTRGWLRGSTTALEIADRRDEGQEGYTSDDFMAGDDEEGRTS